MCVIKSAGGVFVLPGCPCFEMWMCSQMLMERVKNEKAHFSLYAVDIRALCSLCFIQETAEEVVSCCGGAIPGGRISFPAKQVHCGSMAGGSDPRGKCGASLGK